MRFHPNILPRAIETSVVSIMDQQIESGGYNDVVSKESGGGRKLLFLSQSSKLKPTLFLIFSQL